MTVSQTSDGSAIEQFIGKMLNDFGAAVSAPLVIIGDRLGLFKALAELGPSDSTALAERTGTTERYIREWLAAMATAGYVEYDTDTYLYAMSAEQIAVFADEHSPLLMTGGYYSMASIFHDEQRVAEAFKTGQGLSWGDRNACLFCGTERFFRPSYEAHLLQDWLPAMTDAVDKLERGARVADVGCGHGVSTCIMAQAYPNSTFVGFDIHQGSVERAIRHAEELGLTNVRFEVSDARRIPSGWDLVMFFDCLHDMGDPIGAAAHVYRSLADDGAWLIVEPMAGDRLEDNFNPISRIYYGFSTAVCVPTALSQDVGLALGTQAGEAKLKEVIHAGGFNSVRRAAATPFNLILEARR